MRKPIVFVVFSFLLLFSAGMTAAAEPQARILLLNNHPSDLAQAIENSDGISLPSLLAFLALNDLSTIDTVYVEKSLVTVLRGPLKAGARLTLKFRQYVEGKEYNYEVVTGIPLGVRTDPAIVVNSFRIKLPARVHVRAYLGEELVAEKQFTAE